VAIKPSRSTPSRIRGRELEYKALQLRKAGASFRAIAEALGVSKTAAHKAVHRALDRLDHGTDEYAKRTLKLELERLDEMFLGVYPRAKRGDEKAINSALKIMERRARYLGLDAPTPIEHSVARDTLDALLAPVLEVTVEQAGEGEG